MNNDYNSSNLRIINTSQTDCLLSQQITSTPFRSPYLSCLKISFLFLLGIGTAFTSLGQSTGTYGPFCEDGAMETLIGTPAGGTWAVASITPNPNNVANASLLGSSNTTTAIFDPAALGNITTTITVTATYTPSGGTAISTNIIVNPMPTVSVTTPATDISVCENDADLTLIGSPVPSGAARGVWSGTGIMEDINLVDPNATFDPSGSSGDIDLLYTYTNGNGCVAAATREITVYKAGIKNITSGQSICKNANAITLEPETALIGTQTGTWNGPGVTNTMPLDGTGSFDPSIVSGNATITYTFQDGTNGCTDVASVTVTVNDVPTVDNPGNFTLCPGETFSPVFFTGSTVPGTVYNWVNNNATSGLTTSESGSIPAFVATNSGTADIVSTITVTPTANGCSPSPAMTFTITVKPAATITGIGTNPTTCGGYGTIQISGLTNSANYTLSYQQDGSEFTTNITADASGNHLIPNLPAGVYSEIKVDDGICPSNALADITLSNPVIPTVNSVNNQVLCPGEMTQTIIFTGTADTYEWTHDNSNIGLPTSPGTGTINAFTVTNTTTSIEVATITVTPKNSTNCEGTPVTFTITVNPNPTVNTHGDQTICAGADFALVHFVSTPAGATFNWTNDAISIGLASTGQGDISAFTGANSGLPPATATIAVTPTLAGCSAPTNNTETFTLTVNPIPTVINPGNQAVCVGDIVVINLAPLSSAGGAIAGVTYKWVSDNAEIGLDAIDTTTANATMIPSFMATNLSNVPISSNITITPLANNCEGTPVQFTITVNPLPAVDPVADQMVCEGESSPTIFFTGSNVAGITYKWEKQAGQNAAIGLNGNDGLNTLLSFTALNNSNTSLAVNFEVTAEANGCTSSSPAASFTITVNPKPTINTPAFLANSPFCAGDLPITITGSPTPNTSPPSFGLWSGPGISNVDGGAGTATLDPSSLQGTVTLTYDFVDDNGCTNTKNFDIVVRNAQPSIPNLGPFCSESGVQTFSGNPLPNVALGQTATWSIAANTGAIGSPSLTSTVTAGQVLFNPLGLSGDYTLTYTFTDEFNCDVFTESVITVGSPNIVTGTYGPVCENGDVINLAGMPVPNSNQGETSQWTGSGITSFNETMGTAIFNPNGLSGTKMIRYTIANTMTGCIDSQTTTIVVNPTPTVNAGTYAPVCEDATLATGFLVGSPNPSAAGGVSGKWEGPNLSVTDNNTTGDGMADFNPSGLSGPITLSYTFVDDNGCSAIDETIIQVNPLPIADAGPFDTLCANGNPLLLTGKPILQSSETGKWSGTGISTSSVTPSAGTAIFDPTNLSGNITLTYTYVNNKGCSDVATTQYTIQSLPNAVAGPDQTLCEAAMPITLTGNLLTANQTGVWSGSTGVVDGGDGDHVATFNPAGLLVNNMSTLVTLTFTVTDEHGCEAAANLTVTINPPPTVNAGTYEDVCENSTVLLKGLPDPSISGGTGTWTSNDPTVALSAVSTTLGTATLNPSGLTGAYKFIYTYKDNDNCEVNDTATITVKQPTTGIYGPFCSNDSPITLTGSPIPGPTETGKWELVSGTGQMANTVVDQSDKDAVAVFDPTGLTGAIVLKYVFTDADGCSDEAMVTIMVNALPTINLLPYSDVCINGAMVDLLGGPAPSTGTMGEWSGLGVVQVDKTNGTAKFDPSIAGAGTHTLTYIYTDLNNCANEMASTGATTTITVNPLPVLTASGSSTICATNFGYLSGSPAPNNSGGTANWTGPGVINVNSMYGSADIDAAAAGVGTHTYTYTYQDANGCEAMTTFDVEIKALPTVSAGTDKTVCIEGGLINLLGAPTPSDNNQSGTWSGFGVQDDSATPASTADAAGIFDPTVTGAGTHQVTYYYMDANGCNASSTLNITVIELVTPTFANTIPSNLCEESMAIEVAGLPIPTSTTQIGNWSGDGITPSGLKDGKAAFNPSELTGDIIITYTFEDDSGCAQKAEHIITVTKLVADAGTYDAVCESATMPLELNKATVPTANQTIEWSGDGVVNTDEFDHTLITGSSAELTFKLMETLGSGAVCMAEDKTTLVVATPTINLTTIAPICANETITLTGNPIPNGTATGMWSGTGVTNVSATEGIATFSLSNASPTVGEILTYTYTDENGCMNSATVNVVVYDLPATPTIMQGASSTICENAGQQTISATPPATGTGVWTSNKGGIISQTNTTVTFDPSGFNNGEIITFSYDFTDQNGCSAITATHLTTITKLAATATASKTTICASESAITLTGTPTANGTGVWTLPDNTPLITNTSGVAMFDPTGFIGAIALKYTFTETGGASCVLSAITTVNVTAVDIQLTDYGTICKQSGLKTIIGNPIPTIGEKGIWTSNIANAIIEDSDGGDGAAMFDPSMVTANSPEEVTLTYTFTDINGCMNTGTTIITVYDVPSAMINLPFTSLCEEGGIVTLSGATPLPTANGATGIWSADKGIISNSADGTATFDSKGITGSVDLIYTYKDISGCTSKDTVNVPINNSTVDVGTYNPVCINQPIVSLIATSSGTVQAGEWSGTGVTENNNATDGTATFDPIAAGYGTHTLTYTITNTDNCETVSTTTITVIQPTTGTYGPICSNEGTVTLTGNTFTGGTGVWTGNGITDTGNGSTATFDPLTANLTSPVTATYTYTLNGCSDAVTTQITVNQAPTANAGTDLTTCASANALILTGSAIPTGGSSQWTGTGITDADQTDVFAIFNPAGSSGPITLTYEVEDANGCTAEDTKVATVNNLSVSAGTYPAICENADSITLTGTPVGGTWVGFGISDKGNGTATFGPNGKSGDITVSYTVNDGTCTEIASTTITIFAAQVSTGTYGPLCQNDAPLTVTGFPIPSSGAIGTWSGTGLTNINSNTGTATLDPATLTGNTSLTYTFIADGCSKSATTNVLINQSATAAITIDQTQICEGGSVQLTASTTNAAGVTWATSGIGSFSVNFGNSTTYTPSGTITGTNRIDEISVVAVASTGNCPVAVASTNLRIVKPATVDLGQAISFCEVTSGTLTPVTLGTGNTVSWASTNGTFSSNTNTSPIYTANSLTTASRTDVITITAKDAFNTCPTASDAMNITLTNPIKISEGATGAICEGDTIVLTANYTSNMGTFTSQVNNNQGNVIIHAGAIKYVPNAHDGLTIRKDTVVLVNPDLDGNGTCIIFRDTMIVDVSPKATVNLIADTVICVGEQINLLISTTGNFTAFSSSLNLSTSASAYPSTVVNLTTASITDKVFYSTQLPGSICPAEIDSVEVTINNVSTTNLNLLDTTICAINTVELAAGVTGSIYNWEVLGNTGSLSDPTLINPIYTPNTNNLASSRMDSLVLNLSATTDRCNTGTDTMVVTVLNIGSFTPVPDTLLCSNDSIALAVPIVGDYNLFTWSSPNGTFSSTTDSNTVYTPATLNTERRLDTIVTNIQFTASAGSCPILTDTAIITILAHIVINAGVDTTICEGIDLQLAGSLSNRATTGMWQVIGGAGTFDDATSMTAKYTPSALINTTRLDTLVLDLVSPTDECNTGPDTLIVTINKASAITPLSDTIVCTNNTIALDVPIIGTYSQFTWSSPNGTFSSDTDTNTVYTPTTISTGSHIDTVVATIQFATNICPAIIDTSFISVLTRGTVDAGIDATLCSGLGIGLTGTLGNGATTGIWQVVGGFGTFDDASSLTPIYTPNPLGTTNRIDALVLTTNDPDGTDGCLATTDTVLITVTPAATANLGQDLTIFDGQSITLTATTSEAVISSQWSSTPGSLANSGLDQTTFTPLPLGSTGSRVDQIIYQAFFTNQNCGSTTDTLLVTVNAPQAINKATNNDFCENLCLAELTVNIDGNTGTAVVLANNINPLDTCGINTQFDFKFWDPTMPMTEPNTIIDIPNLPNTLTFNCNDRGQQAVNVYVSDNAMNTQLCPVVINVEDTNIFCGERTITGKITNTSGEPVVGFDVFAAEIGEVGGIVPSVKTDANGVYSFSLTSNRQYRITPSRNIDITDGVTAFDNVIISRHILGLEPFVSPYQTIAADVNKSGTVTAFDIVIIRKIVLSRDGAFDNNTSWRFIDANYQFPNILDAASAPFQESFLVSETTGNVSNMDFIAVKIGDVNGTNSSTDGLTTTAESRNDLTPLTFETTNLRIEKGKIYEIPFQLRNETKIAAYQFTLDFEGLALLDIQSGIATPAHFETKLAKKGLLTTCWSTPHPVRSTDTWFTLQFKATTNGRLSELLTVNSEITPIEAYTSDAANIGVQLTFKEPVGTTFDLFQNKPNPFKNQTIIGFALPQAAPAKITVMDMQGKILYSIVDNYKSGYNEVIIQQSQLPKGVFYYRLETAFGTKTQKMMHLE